MKDTEIQDLVTRAGRGGARQAFRPGRPGGPSGPSRPPSPRPFARRRIRPRRSGVDAALAKRDEAEAERAKAEDEKMAMKKKAKTTRRWPRRDRAKIEADAEFRAELITMCRSADMFPKDFDPKGKTRAELLVAAVGNEVTDAAKRSEEYLFAKVETIAERRAAAAMAPPSFRPSRAHRRRPRIRST